MTNEQREARISELNQTIDNAKADLETLNPIMDSSEAHRHFAYEYSGDWDVYQDGVLGLWITATEAEGNDPRAEYEVPYGEQEAADFFERSGNVEKCKECMRKAFKHVPEGSFSTRDCDALYLLLEDINYSRLELPRGQLR